MLGSPCPESPTVPVLTVWICLLNKVSEMNDEARKPNRTGRWVGALIFAIGMAMLVAVFALAALAFAGLPQILDGASRSGSQGLIHVLTGVGARVAFLVVMAYVSSLIASKGLELFYAARGVE